MLPTKRPSFAFSFGLNLIPNKRVVASAATTCPVEFLLIPPMYFDKSNFFLVIGLRNYKEKKKKEIKTLQKKNSYLKNIHT